jgi:iron(III) transport system permease protein
LVGDELTPALVPEEVGQGTTDSMLTPRPGGAARAERIQRTTRDRRPGRLVRLRWNPWTVLATLIGMALSVPVLVVAAGALTAAGETWSHLVSTVLPEYLRNSALLVLGVGALALLIGIVTAWLVAACEFPARRIFEWALILPLSVPAYIAAYTYAGMLDVTGPVQRILRGVVPGWSERVIYLDIMRFESIVVIFGVVLYPYVYLIARGSFLGQSRTALEASRVLGMGAWQGFFRVALPLARPALAAGLTLVSMEVLNDYGAVAYYGVSTFTTGIFRAWLALGDLGAAVRLAAFLMIFIFVVLAVERGLRRGKRVEESSGSHRPLRRYELRGFRAAAAFTICLIPLLIGFLIPVAQLGYWAVLTARHVVDVGFLRLVLNTFLLATAASSLCVVLALLLAYATRLSRTLYMNSVSRVAVLGYSIPGAVIAVGVLMSFGWVDRTIDAQMQRGTGISTGLLLSGSLAALLFAYAVRFLAVALLPVEAGFEQQCRNLDEASRSLGIPPFATLRRVALPLLRSTLLGAMILVFVDVLKEIPLTLVLRPFNFDTLATKAFQLAMDEQIAESANAALVVIVTGLVPIIWLNKLFSRRDA